MNTGFADDRTVFLMVPDDQFAELLAVSKIEIESERGHARLKVGKLELGKLGKLGGLTNGLADPSDNVRRYPGRRGHAEPFPGRNLQC
jgi:hypothetical protein